MEYIVDNSPFNSMWIFRVAFNKVKLFNCNSRFFQMIKTGITFVFCAI